LTDTRDPQQYVLQKKRIAAQVKKHTNSVTAVLVLANGTVPRVNSVGTNYDLSTLSSISPRTPSKNVAFLLTNTSGPLYQNFSRDILPECFKDAPHFLLNNPIALQRRYLKLEDEPSMRSHRTHFREAVKAGEQDALEMLVELFDWLDRLGPQSVSLHEQSQGIVAKITDPLAQRAKVLLRAVKDKAQAGVRRVKRVFICE
jgi:hypothetical protein